MDEISYSRLSSLPQAQQIESLNVANLRENVPSESAGFLTVLYPASMLMQLAQVCPPTIAVHRGTVVGFLVLMPADVGKTVRELTHVVAGLPGKRYKGRELKEYRFVRCGPVCVHAQYRGRHIAKKLYEHALREINCDLMVTRVNQSNIASLKAHFSLGFSAFHTEKEGETTWIYIAREAAKPKL